MKEQQNWSRRNIEIVTAAATKDKSVSNRGREGRFTGEPPGRLGIQQLRVGSYIPHYKLYQRLWFQDDFQIRSECLLSEPRWEPISQQSD